MGRHPKHDPDALLDTALAIAAAEGPAGVTMVAVARRAGAPSGSLYHRFPGRPALLGELWLRTVGRFQAGWLEALRDDDPHAGIAAGARHVVTWSRRNRDEARLLLYGPDELGRADWPDATRRAVEVRQRAAEAALHSVAAALGGGREALDRATFAAVDVPYAAVRRPLAADRPIPASTEALVERCVQAILR